MNYSEQEKLQLYKMNQESIGSGLYMLDIAKKMNKVAYPWAPTVRLQKMGNSINKNMSLIDTESDLFNIVNINTKDPSKKYIPDPNKTIDYEDLPDGFFHEENTFLTNPPSELRGLTKNRWYELTKNPQANCLNPFSFPLGGISTYNEILNDKQEC